MTAAGSVFEQVSGSRSRWMPWLSIVFAVMAAACDINQRQSGLPPDAQATIDTITADMSAGRYQKIHEESAEEWRQKSDTDQTEKFFTTLRDRLGNIRTRTFLEGRIQENRNSAGRHIVVRFNTSFARADGIETFNLVERDGRWLLAGYVVSSDALR